jgi:cytochrome b
MSMNSAAFSQVHRVRVWDLPTRIFHWALALCIAALAITAYAGGNAMIWHFRTGFAVLALLLFRLVWGVVGGRWSRFRSFVYAPSTVVRYLQGRGKPEHSVGHTPTGAGSVFALLTVLLAQVGSGLISDDEIASAGPLTRFVSSSTVSLATNYHADIGKWLILALVVLHIGAIVFYLRRQQNLIGSMLHGDKKLAGSAPASRDDAASRALAVFAFALCAAFAAWVSSLAA